MGTPSEQGQVRSGARNARRHLLLLLRASGSGPIGCVFGVGLALLAGDRF